MKLSTKERRKRRLRQAGGRKRQELARRILNAAFQLQNKGEIVTFSKLLRILGVSSRTLSKYLKILEREGRISRRKVGELIAISVDQKEIIPRQRLDYYDLKGNLLKRLEVGVIESPEIFTKLFRGRLTIYAVEAYDFLKFLTYYDAGRKFLDGEFSGLSYKKFFERFHLDILGLLMRMCNLEPLNEKQRALWYAIFCFLKRNLNTIPLIVNIFFPIFEIPKRELKKFPPNLILLMKSLPKDFHPPPQWYEPPRRIISENKHGL